MLFFQKQINEPLLSEKKCLRTEFCIKANLRNRNNFAADLRIVFSQMSQIHTEIVKQKTP